MAHSALIGKRSGSRARACFLRWSGSFTGTQLMLHNNKILEITADTMGQSGLFFATVLMRVLQGYNPGSMGSPAVVTGRDNVGGGKGGKGGKGGGRGERRTACPDYQRTGNACTPRCALPHICEWCGASSHGGKICTTPAARRFRGE